MANKVIDAIAQSLEKIEEERQQEIQSLRTLVQKQNEEITSLREMLVRHIGKPETYKVAGIWDPNEYISSSDERLWGESGLFCSQWAFQYAVRELGCPFVAASGCKRKRLCKASTLEKWLNNNDVRKLLDQTIKMRKKRKDGTI